MCYVCNLYDLGTDFEGKTQVGFKSEDFNQKKKEEFSSSKNGRAVLRNS
jgi:hypothetical protein